MAVNQNGCHALFHLSTCSQFLMPGLVDTHIHAPQYVNAGTGYDKQLLAWLKDCTFPAEARFQDLQVARDVYPIAVVSLCCYMYIYVEVEKSNAHVYVFPACSEPSNCTLHPYSEMAYL